LAKRSCLLAAALFICPSSYAGESTCFGTVSNGRLENGVKLPTSGANFSTYSAAGSIAGRTYVHHKVHDVVIAAYQAVERTMPQKTFVYGESGGGRRAAESGRTARIRTGFPWISWCR
jgi:penicillin-insensitive murein DD-endopeptidase